MPRTNREWMMTLSDIRLAEVMSGCSSCIAGNEKTDCSAFDCKTGRLRWLRQIHKEAEPKEQRLLIRRQA